MSNPDIYFQYYFFQLQIQTRRPRRSADPDADADADAAALTPRELSTNGRASWDGLAEVNDCRGLTPTFSDIQTLCGTASA